MNYVQTLFNSARFNRYMLWFGVAVFVAGALALTLKLAGGSDNTQIVPDKGFHAVIQKQGRPLKNSHGVTVRTFEQLDPQVREAIRTFIGTAVVRKHLDQSWAVIAPSMRKGYTFAQWKTADALPIIPYPVADLNAVNYFLDYASTQEILIDVGVWAKPSRKLRPTTFQIALVPVGHGKAKRWLVNYWMPRWSPLVPQG